MGWVVNATPRPLYPWERDPVPIVLEAVLAPGQVCTGAENLRTEIRSADRIAHSGSLYRLSFRGCSIERHNVGVLLVFFVRCQKKALISLDDTLIDWSL